MLGIARLEDMRGMGTQMAGKARNIKTLKPTTITGSIAACTFTAELMTIFTILSQIRTHNVAKWVFSLCEACANDTTFGLIQVTSGLTLLHYKGASLLTYAADPTWLCYRLKINRFQRLIGSLENRFLKESFGSESFSRSLMRINEKYRFLDATLFLYFPLLATNNVTHILVFYKH